MNADEILRLAVECQLLTTENRNGIYAGALIRFANRVHAKALAEQPAEQSAKHMELVRGEWQGYTWNPYAIPQPKAEPLTDEEIYECERIAAIRHHRHKNSIRGQQITPADDPQWHFARAIERAHGIGEHE